MYILNVADDWIPSDMAVDDEEQIEEERRLLYVAMTRAKDHLHLSYPSRFYTYGFKHRRADRNIYSVRSRFISEGILDLFHRDTFKKNICNDGAETGTQRTNVAEKIIGLWD